MKWKYLVILMLFALLAVTVVRMMKYESAIRKERKVTYYVEDEQKPLMEALPDDELRQTAMGSDYRFLARGDFFSRMVLSYHEGEKEYRWEDFLLKGVNLGVAVPGKFPAEFPQDVQLYLEWLEAIGRMNANIIRTYTILPPVFYQALSRYNFHHADKPLYLMQGVWAEVPEDENYFNPRFSREFKKEIIDAIDVLHGRAVLREKPGKASGVYSTDVSRYVAAILLGREWEPASVHKTNQVNKSAQYQGNFICMNQGTPMEAWLAEMLDFTVLYETQQYQAQRPVSFVNWLPLDPMYHSTEIIENAKVREYDNDLESISFSRFHSTGLFAPGIFAAYHVYPYYPDYIYLQPSYTRVSHAGQADPYLGYLQDLKAHHEGMPLVVAEYGLPSSRGNSHYSPYGMHQGGHSEKAQAELSLVLTQDIVEAGCGGAIYFEWIDEWFKHNWLVMDFEQPYDDRQLWHNMENPEENFGIMALEDKRKVIDGTTGDWAGKSFQGDNPGIMTDGDATYFYLALNIPDLDFVNENVYVAIDTYDEEKGDHRLPFLQEEFSNGFEFLLEFRGSDSAAILVDEPYSVYTDIYHDLIPGYASESNSNGRFIRQLMLTNRSRTSLLGVRTDSILLDRSVLAHGISSDPATSNADWYYDPRSGVLEVRLDWHLVNVTDPAKKFVLDNRAGTPDIEVTRSDRFNLVVFRTGKDHRRVTRYPANGLYAATWQEWDIPVYTSRYKPVYYMLKDYFGSLNMREIARPGPAGRAEATFAIARFKDGKKGAASISFDNAGYSQYQYAWPILQKYHLKASFGVDPMMMEDASGMVRRQDDGSLKRFGYREARELAAANEIALQANVQAPLTRRDIEVLAEKSGIRPQTLHSASGNPTAPLIFSRPEPGKEGSVKAGFQGIRYTVASGSLGVSGLADLLNGDGQEWMILVYHHLYENKNEIPHQAESAGVGNLFLPRQEFEKQLRLLRNEGLWVAPEGDVFRYLKERSVATLRTERYENMIFLRVLLPLDQEVFNYPLSVEYTSGDRIIRVKGSENDGTYQNYNGSIIFNVRPGHEITLEIIE